MRAVALLHALLVAGLTQGERAVPQTVVQGHTTPPIRASASVSGDGSFVALESMDRLDPADTNALNDIYVLNVRTGQIDLVTAQPDGTASADSALEPRLSGDGRYVVFASSAPAPQLCATVFLHDRKTRVTRPIVFTRDEPPRVACGDRPTISADGSWIAFESSATDLVDGEDANGKRKDVYETNTFTGVTVRISVDSGGRQSSIGSSFSPTLSADGRFVAFTSTACLKAGSNSGQARSANRRQAGVYVRDVVKGVTRPIKTMRNQWPNGPTYSPALSADGRFVAFTGEATNLLEGRTNSRPNIYLWDLQSGALEVVSRTPEGRGGNGASSLPAISGNGRFVAFDSVASDLTSSGASDQNLVTDVFLMDRKTGRLRRLSHDSPGQPWWEASVAPSIDDEGRVVTFSSRHATHESDTRGDFDLYVLNIYNHATYGDVASRAGVEAGQYRTAHPGPAR